MRRGTTLLELATVLLLLSAGLAVVVPVGLRARDAWSAGAAREALIALVARTRAEAVRYGGASLHLVSEGARARIEAGATVRTATSLAAGYGVELAPGGADSVALHFDALGLGRAASLTVRLVRGSAASTLVISSYGRVARR